jgi:alkylation response protein AidB-like acyl-CoA dehydrogenase
MSTGREAISALLPRPLPDGFVLPTLHEDRSVAVDMAAVFVASAAEGRLVVPLPGAGQTTERFAALAETSAVDLSLGRLVEGHTDAVAILAEAGMRPPPGAVLGVWAARRPDADVAATARPGGGWRLRGRKPWASGARLLTHALVTAACGDGGPRLFLVALHGNAVAPRPGTWPAVGMALSESVDVDFDVAVSADAALGPPGWYVDRPGFWFGSVGVAACWQGGALGLTRAVSAQLAAGNPDGHQLAHLGAAAARCASMARDIDWAAQRIDATPDDPGRAVQAVALQVRHLIEDGCVEVAARVGRAGGAGPLCRDQAQARRFADLPVYIRQHHAERDDETLGRFILEEERRT